MKFEKGFTMYIGDKKRRLICKFTNTIHKYCFESKKDMNLIDDVSVSPYSYSVLYKLKVKQAWVLNTGTYKYNNNKNKNTSRSK